MQVKQVRDGLQVWAHLHLAALESHLVGCHECLEILDGSYIPVAIYPFQTSRVR